MSVTVEQNIVKVIATVGNTVNLTVEKKIVQLAVGGSGGGEGGPETDPIFSASEAANLVDGDKQKLDDAFEHSEETGNPHSTTKGDIGLSNVDNTSDVNKPISTAIQTALDTKQATIGFTPENPANKNQANGYAGLDSSSKINPSQLPSIAINDTFVVASQVAMLALTAQTGDIAIRTDLSKTFILSGTDPTNLAHWTELSTPTDTVTSVNGMTGAVTVDSDDIDDTGKTHKFTTAAEASKLAGIETSADVTDAGNVGGVMTAATAKTTPIDADTIPLSDSADSNTIKKVTWANIKATWKAYTDTLYQALNANLTAIAGLSPSNDDVIQRKAGAWVNRTIAQLKSDFGLVKADVGLGNVDNTSNATERAAVATLTNKRVTPRVGTTASSATPAINTDDYDIFTITALAVAITSMSSSLSGTPTVGQKLIIRIKDNGTARAITWGASFTASTDLALPTTTTLNKTLYCGFIYNGSTWDLIAKLDNF